MKKDIEILIVEDSPTQAELLTHILENEGYHISVAYNGKEAIESIKKLKPTIVISDILMPEMDGFQLCRYIKKEENFKDIIVVLLTILSDPEDVLKGLECGADNFIHKPYASKELISRIEFLTYNKSIEKKKKDIEILLVEDSDTQAKMLQYLLQGMDYNVTVSANGKEAIDQIRKNKPDLIISDILMPKMDGYELCRRIKQDKAFKDIPVILLTKLSDQKEIVQGYSLGADAYITKPYDETHLLTKIKILLDSKTLSKKGAAQEKLEVDYEDKHYVIESTSQQLLNFLISIYDSAVKHNRMLINTQHELRAVNQQLNEKIHELLVSDERFETLVKTIPDIVYRINKEGIFIFLNESIRKLGYEPEELIGRHFSEIILPPQYKSVAREHVLPKYTGKVTKGKDAPKLFDERRTGDRMTIGLEVGLFSKSHKIRPGVLKPLGKDAIIVEVNSSGMYEINPDTENKVFIGTVGVIRDITERKRAEETLYKAMCEAEKANQAKSEFLANISHEFRTPLNAIIGFADMMMKGMTGKLSKKQMGFVENISESGELLLSLINDILDLSKIEAGKMEIEYTEVDIKDIIKQSITLFKEKMRKQRLKLTTEIKDNIETFKANERRIKQVLVNLLSNAVKFTPDGGSISLQAGRHRSELEGNSIEFSIADTGPGIKPEDIAKLFTPFQQLDSSYSKKHQGTGLGLALCKKIVEGHGGKIWIESKVGKGSRFIFRIPAR